MKHLKKFEASDFSVWDIGSETRDLFGLTEKISVGSDFYLEGPKSTRDLVQKYIKDIESTISGEEPRYSYYYQDISAVKIVYDQNKKLEKFKPLLDEIDWRIVPCILGYYGSSPLGNVPGFIHFWVMDKKIQVPIENKSEDELKKIGKKIARENGVTHIASITKRIPIEEWDGSRY